MGAGEQTADRRGATWEGDPGAAGQGNVPCASWAALGWLETSIRSYAKFVDVAAKATASEEGEAAVMKRERVAIDDVRALLDEMRVETRRRMAAADEAEDAQG